MEFRLISSGNRGCPCQNGGPQANLRSVMFGMDRGDTISRRRTTTVLPSRTCSSPWRGQPPEPLSNATGRWKRLPITLAGFGMFPGESSVLWLAPVATADLVSFHTTLLRALADLSPSVNVVALFCTGPGQYTPAPRGDEFSCVGASNTPHRTNQRAIRIDHLCVRHSGGNKFTDDLM
jgi:hypothetical protein